MGKQGKLIGTLQLFLCCLTIGIVCLCAGCGEKKSTPETTKKATETNLSTSKVTESNDEGNIVTDSEEIDAMAAAIVKNMSLEEKIGQMFVVNLEQLDDSQGDCYEFREYTDDMKTSMDAYKIGGVILFARNIESVNQTKKLIQDLQDNAQIPLFISVDEEGGDVARVGNNSNMRTTTFPPMEEVGEMDDEQYAYNMGVTIANDIKNLGFNLDFAPVADVKTNEHNTEIGNRAFGSDADLVSDMVEQVVSGIQSQGISATLKHFPGHGSVSGDTHETAVNADTDLITLRSTEFKPFEAGIQAGADFVMVSHISISKVTEDTIPACMSKLVVQTMLREELGFKGVIITDALDMGAITENYEPGEAAVNCVKAGIDVLLMSTDLEASYQAVLEAVEKGTIDESQIDASVRKIMTVKIKRGIIRSNTDLLKR